MRTAMQTNFTAFDERLSTGCCSYTQGDLVVLCWPVICVNLKT